MSTVCEMSADQRGDFHEVAFQPDRDRQDYVSLPVLWHRIATVRQRERVSLRTVARHWRMNIGDVRRQEAETTDLRLSELYRWQEMLGVPAAELLCDESPELANPLLRRAQLVKVMKTVMTIRETSKEVRTQRLVSALVTQLTEIMPELAEVGPWQGCGSRRTTDELGRAAECRLPEEDLARGTI